MFEIINVDRTATPLQVAADGKKILPAVNDKAIYIPLPCREFHMPVGPGNDIEIPVQTETGVTAKFLPNPGEPIWGHEGTVHRHPDDCGTGKYPAVDATPYIVSGGTWGRFLKHVIGWVAQGFTFSND